MECAEFPISRPKYDMFVDHQAADIMEDDVILTEAVLNRKASGEMCSCLRLKSRSHIIFRRDC